MIDFFKYQGTGNDFILIDNRVDTLQLTKSQIVRLCDRRFGIGADGLMLLGLADDYHFSMTYFNSDGAESSMCGNGGRCITAFARHLGLITEQARFTAIDGEHSAKIVGDKVELAMNNVNSIESIADDFVLNTGSPHYIKFIEEDPNSMDNFVEQARSIRNSTPFLKNGINVNFVKSLGEHRIVMRTFERGVEDETLSCGTGAVAAAIANHCFQAKTMGQNIIQVSTPGGELLVSFHFIEAYTSIKLIGTAQYVFKGQISLP